METTRRPNLSALPLPFDQENNPHSQPPKIHEERLSLISVNLGGSFDEPCVIRQGGSRRDRPHPTFTPADIFYGPYTKVLGISALRPLRSFAPGMQQQSLAETCAGTPLQRCEAISNPA